MGRYFAITEQGEGLADTGVHLVDRVHKTLFPDAALDYRRDIRILAASRWPTLVTAAQFRQVTGESRWPDYLAPWLRGDALEYFCNGRLDYRLRGIHVRLETRWDWQAQQGDDTHTALYRGSRSRLELRQGAAEGFRPELYVVPLEGIPPGEIGDALERRIAASQAGYPGVAAEPRGGEWRIVIPDSLRVSYEANFAQFTRRFLAYVGDPSSLPMRETANLLTKYSVCTEAVALSSNQKR